MKYRTPKPYLLNEKGRNLSLSGPALVDLLGAVMERGARFRFQARGFSMSPLIKDGDVVTVSPLLNRYPGLGDIVAVIHQKTGSLVVHRLVGKQGGAYLVKGDNAAERDESVAKENILGWVTQVERKGKRIFLGLGPEKFLIAVLTRTGLLFPIWRLVRPIFRISFNR